MARYYSYLIECGNDVIFFKTYVTITGLTLPLILNQFQMALKNQLLLVLIPHNRKEQAVNK